jgi:hypothetical protein
MGALENLLPEEIKRASLQLGNGEVEFLLPYLEALAAIEIATKNEIAILGVDSHEIRQGSVLTIGLQDGSSTIKYSGDWCAFVQRLNSAARDWVIEHPLGKNHGYILTSASKEEFGRPSV